MPAVGGDQTGSAPSNVVQQADDRFLWGFPLFALCCEIILTTVTYFDRIGGTLILAFFLSILVAAIMLVVAIMGVTALIRGRFKRAAALLLAPSILALQFIFPIGPLEYRALDLLRFYFTKGQYDAVIDKLSPAERSQKVMFFKWGVTGILDAASYYWLVYDESGEIALSDAERSQAWKDRVYPEHRLVDEHCLTLTQRLSGHYYSMVMHCADAG